MTIERHIIEPNPLAVLHEAGVALNALQKCVDSGRYIAPPLDRSYHTPKVQLVHDEPALNLLATPITSEAEIKEFITIANRAKSSYVKGRHHPTLTPKEKDTVFYRAKTRVSNDMESGALQFTSLKKPGMLKVLLGNSIVDEAARMKYPSANGEHNGNGTIATRPIKIPFEIMTTKLHAINRQERIAVLLTSLYNLPTFAIGQILGEKISDTDTIIAQAAKKILADQ